MQCNPGWQAPVAPGRRAVGELRVTHASPDAPEVNVYVDGELALERVPYLASSGLLPIAEPVISDLAYPQTTGQLVVSPGEYWVTVTAAGDKSVVAFELVPVPGAGRLCYHARLPRPGGEIGRHRRLKISRSLRSCRFESGSGHQ